MKKSWNLFEVLFFISYFILFVINTTWDFAYPGREPHWMHNPWWNAPAGVVFFSVIVLGYRSEWKARRRKKRDARLLSRILIVEELFKAGRREEGEKAYALYHRIKAAGSQREEDTLAKQFSDLYHI